MTFSEPPGKLSGPLVGKDISYPLNDKFFPEPFPAMIFAFLSLARQCRVDPGDSWFLLTIDPGSFTDEGSVLGGLDTGRGEHC